MSSSRALRLLVSCVLGCSLSGCYQIMRSANEPLAATASGLEERASHYGDILRELGPPSKLTAQPRGFAFLYEYLETRERQLGYSLGFSVEGLAADLEVPLGRLSVARGRGEMQTLMVEFDDEGQILGIGFTRREQDLGWGFGVTPPVMTRDLVVAGVSRTTAGRIAGV
jgi:hypothetical protein